MTAAYMTRAIWLTFFGEYRGHGTPHESPRVMTVPALDPGRRRRRRRLPQPARASWPRTASRSASSTTSSRPSPSRRSSTPSSTSCWPASRSLLAVLGIVARPGSTSPATGARTASPNAARAGAWGYRVLENKYYLDALYTDVIVGGIKGPIAAAVYWFNQNVIDGVVNGAGDGARVTRPASLYRDVDQGGRRRHRQRHRAPAPRSSGQFLRHIQTGKVQQYAALLFAGAAVLAGIFVVHRLGARGTDHEIDFLERLGADASRRSSRSVGAVDHAAHPQGGGAAAQGRSPWLTSAGGRR